jgi:hypothetical protein
MIFRLPRPQDLGPDPEPPGIRYSTVADARVDRSTRRTVAVVPTRRQPVTVAQRRAA